jgi:uncharacterized protein YndB with AHSA1/START domain
MNNLPFQVDRDVVIRAQLTTVFGFLSDSALFARWWGAGSSIEATVGGAVRIVYPNGAVAAGRVLAIESPRQLAFTFGYEGAGKPIAPGGSVVRITLHEHADGTLVRLRHEVDSEATREAHVPGWCYQLALFANVAADAQHAGLEQIADAWFTAWNETDATSRDRALHQSAADNVTFRDRYSCGVGLAELAELIAQSQRFMPGNTIRRDGAVRHCQGAAAVDWAITGADGAPLARGTNILRLAADGRIAESIGLWRS